MSHKKNGSSQTTIQFVFLKPGIKDQNKPGKLLPGLKKIIL